MLRHRLLVAALAASGLLVSAPAAGAQARRGLAAPAKPKPFFDIRNAQPSPRAPSAATRSARSRLRSAGAVVGVDARTGAVRFLAGRAAPLSAAAAGDRRDLAERYLRGHLAALGLARADLGSLRLERRAGTAGGALVLGYRQYADGIPSFEGGLRIVVDAHGRVASITGPVEGGLSLASDVPRLTATDAMRRAMASVGVQRAVRVASGPSGVRRATRFTSGEAAALVVFGEGTSARLAWQLDLRAGPGAHYAAVVDARTGELLYRANRVKSAANDAMVWEQYPGATNGGTAHPTSLTPYLDPGATDLSGPYAHAWSDTNDSDSGTTSSDGHIVPNDHPDAGEAVGRTGTGGSFTFPFQEVTAAQDPFGACEPAHKCSWNYDAAPTDSTNWRTNRAQNAVQAFYYVNRYREHLLAAPIGFTAGDGNFDNGDRLLVNTDDGAATGANHPDSNHVDNAYMDTPPDGTSPTMAMFLFFNDSATPDTPADFRDANGGDDAEIVYHEYTHGLSGRLVTVNPSGGEEALNGSQSGGMGEGWSDWYAKDFLIDEFPGDDTATAGDVDMGKYIDSVPHTIRSQGLDCPVGAAAAQCPGTTAQGSGGYTYGDFNTTPLDTSGHHEVHAVGEIWGETLWDLRAALGSGVAEAIVTQGMRISPPEPTFLDERDAILTADRQLFPDNDHSGVIWQVFAHRGMGTDAVSPSQDVAVEGFKRPATAGLAVSPSPATQGQPVTLDASGSSAPDTHITTYDFDFQGDGVNDVSGTTNPRQSFTYTAPGTFHPTVTVHDDGGFTDTAARALRVDAAPTPTPTPIPSPPPTITNPLAPQIVLARTGRKGRVRLTVRCDSACTGTARLTVSRKLAKKLHLGKRRTVGKVAVRLSGAGQKRFTVKLTKRTLRAMKRAGVRRIALRLAATVTDAEHQRTARHRTSRIRR